MAIAQKVRKIVVECDKVYKQIDTQLQDITASKDEEVILQESLKYLNESLMFNRRYLVEVGIETPYTKSYEGTGEQEKAKTSFDDELPQLKGQNSFEKLGEIRTALKNLEAEMATILNEDRGRNKFNTLQLTEGTSGISRSKMYLGILYGKIVTRKNTVIQEPEKLSEDKSEKPSLSVEQEFNQEYPLTAEESFIQEPEISEEPKKEDSKSEEKTISKRKKTTDTKNTADKKSTAKKSDGKKTSKEKGESTATPNEE